MATYIIRRIVQSLLFIFAASLLLYSGLVFMPNGPNYQREQAQQQGWLTHDDLPGYSVQDFDDQFKLDKPWPLCYFTWLFDPGATTFVGYNSQNVKVTMSKGIDLQIGNFQLRGSGILTGDFGETPYGNSGVVAVSDLLASRWQNSLYLFLIAFALALILGVPLGVLGAARKGSLLDHSLTVFTLSGISTPPYALSFLLIIVFAIGLKSLHDGSGWGWIPWFPAGGFDSGDVWSRLYFMALPATALAIPQMARIARHTRFALLDVLRQDYIRTARAKGLGFGRILFKHALRNSLTTIVTQVALFVPLYISAGAAVESAFGYSGLGREFYRAVGGCLFSTNMLTTDPPPCPVTHGSYINVQLVLPLLMIMVVLITLSTLLADLSYLIVDPRISYAARGKSL